MDIEEKKKGDDIMSFINELESKVLFKGEKAPLSVELPNSFSLVQDETADGCNPSEFMDYELNPSHPPIRLCLHKNSNNEWKVKESIVGIGEDCIHHDSQEVISAFILQEMGYIKNVVKVKKVYVDELGEDYNFFIPAYNETEGITLTWF